MKIVSLLRRATPRVNSRRKALSEQGRDELICGDLDEQFRIMSGEEFAEYLRMHTKSHRRKV